MELLVAALIAGGFLTLTAHFVRRSRRARIPAQRPRDLLEAPKSARGWGDLRPQDVLLYDGRDLIVRDVLLFDESGRRWQECRLDDEGRAYHLRVEGDELPLILGPLVDPLPLGENPPESLDHGGEIYHLERLGQALAQRVGEPAGEVRYWNYRQPGRACFWLRCRAGEWLYAAGERVERHLVELLPGS